MNDLSEFYMTKKILIAFTVCLFLGNNLLQAQRSRIIFTPQWLPQSQFAGYYAAEEKGFYRDAGLDVSITHISSSSSSAKRLEEGKCHVITLQLVQALHAISEGMQLVNVLQTSQRSGQIIVPRHDNIKKISDLHGIKLAAWLSGFSETAHFLDRERKLNIQWVPYKENISLFIRGAVDAILAMDFNEYLSILSSGINPQQIFRLSDLGYDIPEDGVYVEKSYYETHKEELNAFAEASIRGWQWCEEHPDEAVEIVLRHMKSERIGSNPIFQKRMLQEILREQKDPQTGQATFHLKKEVFEETVRICQKNKLLPHTLSYEDFYKAHE